MSDKNLKKPLLHLICGKIASGKSTLADHLALQPQTILIQEDEWMAALYPNEIKTLEDYVRNSQRLKSVMGPHVIALLSQGLNVVLDFQANTPKTREWMKSLIERSGADHQLHYLDVANEVCKARLRQRNQAGVHQYQTSDEEFDLITSYFIAPQPEEKLNVIIHHQE
jgi:predicted kinase